jgi:hypothetical protein
MIEKISIYKLLFNDLVQINQPNQLQLQVNKSAENLLNNFLSN